MTRSDALTAGPGHSPFTGLDVLRTAGYRTRPGTRRPRFDQDVWDLSCVADAPVSWPRSEQILDFTQVTNPTWRAVARTYLMARLVPTHPSVAVLPHAYRSPLALQTLRHELVRITAWFNHLTKTGLTGLDQIHQRHCDAYLPVVSVGRTNPGQLVTPGTIAGFVLTTQALTAYGPLLPEAYTSGFRPWGERTAAQVAGYQRPNTNQTPTVPDDILRPLLAGASYLIDTISPPTSSRKPAAPGKLSPAGAASGRPSALNTTSSSSQKSNGVSRPVSRPPVLPPPASPAGSTRVGTPPTPSSHSPTRPSPRTSLRSPPPNGIWRGSGPSWRHGSPPAVSRTRGAVMRQWCPAPMTKSPSAGRSR
ncbi:hypothetical protein GCM10020254_66480 [Streptomyces goshikiensis]